MDVKKALGIVAGTAVGMFLILEHETLRLIFLSNDKLDEKREKARQEYCSTSDENLAIKLQRLMDKIDEIKGMRHSEDDYGYPAHSEHGWYLESDD